MAEALYRKYRPQVFEDIVGQEHIERTLKNAIDQNKVSHAYLFTGPRGTGKTSIARLLAKALLCGKGTSSEPDGSCDNCKAIAEGIHPDVYELDAASRTGVDNVREEIIGRVQFAPTLGRYKIYIIDEVHMLSTAAFNALLKTLEEPPSHVVFVLCTTDPQKVPETIHSRCQRFEFWRISVDAIAQRLKVISEAEGIEYENEALELIARRAEGGMRNALTSLEQLIAFGEGTVSKEIAERLLGSLNSSEMAEIATAIGQRDIAACFSWTANFVETGSDLAQFTRDLAEHMRNMYVLSLTGAEVALEVDEETRRELMSEMQYFGADRLTRMLALLGDLSFELKTSSNQRLSFEIALTRMVRPDTDLSLESLAERVEALESGYSAVSHVSSALKARPVSQAQTLGAEPKASDGVGTESHQVIPSTVSSSQDDTSSLRPSADAVQEREDQNVAAASMSEVSDDSEETRFRTMLENPASLQRIWQASLQQIKKEKAAYGVLFINTKAFFDAHGGELIIEFPADNEFAYSTAQKSEAVDMVASALAHAAGRPLAFRYQKKGQERTEEARKPSEHSSMPSLRADETARVEAPGAVRPATRQAVTAEKRDTASQKPEKTEAHSIQPPESEEVPLEAYGSDMLAQEQVEKQDVAESNTGLGQALGENKRGQTAENDSLEANNEEANMRDMLLEGFGEGITFEIIEDA